MPRSDFRSAEQALAPGTGWMSARADALMSQQSSRQNCRAHRSPLWPVVSQREPLLRRVGGRLFLSFPIVRRQAGARAKSQRSS